MTDYLEALRQRQMGGNEKIQKPLPTAPTKGASGWTPPPTPPTPWTDDQWEAFCDLVETLEKHPQLWASLRKYAQKALHRDLYQAPVREGYGNSEGVPVPDDPRGGRIKCRECLRVDHCSLPGRVAYGMELLHHCEKSEVRHGNRL